MLADVHTLGAFAGMLLSLLLLVLQSMRLCHGIVACNAAGSHAALSWCLQPAVVLPAMQLCHGVAVCCAMVLLFAVPWCCFAAGSMQLCLCVAACYGAADSHAALPLFCPSLVSLD
eukprot:364373-Chlamydomonas_euryale.AAC.5